MGKTFSTLVLSLLGGLAALPATQAFAGENSGLTMTIKADQRAGSSKSPHISVQGSSGRYDRISSSGFSLPLTLKGELEADANGDKIIASEVFLKTAGANRQALSVSAGKGEVPSRTVAIEQTFDFDVEPQGPVAQNAISLCNGMSSAGRNSGKAVTLAMAMPVVWRATTGRFTFQWTNYDRVAPSDDIYNNRDFYADQKTTDAETTVDASVTCQPLTVASAAAVSTPPAKSEPAARPVKQDVVETSAPMTTASLVEAGKPQCDGGMIRQIGSGEVSYLCLCPGNTERVETGTNAFVCEKKSNRR